MSEQLVRPVASGAVATPPPAEATHVSGRRFVAHIVDGVVGLVVIVAASFVGGIALGVIGGDVGSAVAVLVLVAGIAFALVGYYVVTQRRNGKTIGKALCGIRVITADGGVPSTGACVKRTLPLLIEWTYVLAFIGMMSSDRRQRLGDRWADTYVVADS
jgi:uncharacterized RDD family membrane protein YckC